MIRFLFAAAALAALSLTSGCSADAEWNKNYTYLQFTPSPLSTDD